MQSTICGITAKGAVFIKRLDPAAEKDYFVTAKSLNWVPQIGDQVEFEAGPPSQPGRSPQALNVRKAAGATTPTPEKSEDTKKKGPSRPASRAQSAEKQPQITVEGPVDPDEDGKFLVTVATRNTSGRLGALNFRVIPLSPIKDLKVSVRKNGGYEITGQNLRTTTTGYLELYIEFTGTQVTLKFVLDNGRDAVIDLAK